MSSLLNYSGVVKSSSSGQKSTNTTSTTTTTSSSTSISDVAMMVDEDELLLNKVFRVIDESKQQQQHSRDNLSKIIIDHEHTLSIQLDNLSEIQTQIQSIEKRAIQLGKTISSTFKLAEGVSSKVRQLHGVQERVQLAIDAVEASIGMKSCVEGVEEAIKIGDYEKAVEYVSRVIHINNDSNRSQLVLQLNQHLGGSGGGGSGDGIESEFEQERRNVLFKKSEMKIKEIVSSKMKEALLDENETQIKRFSKLFSPLCMNHDGLSLYVEFLVDRCRKELESLVHDSLDKVSDLPIELNAIEDQVERLTFIRKQQQQYVSFIDVITQILDIIVSYIEEHDDFVTRNFGGESCTLYLINSLQQVCDKMVKKVLDVYEKKRELNDILNAISFKKLSSSGGGSGSSVSSIKKDQHLMRSSSPNTTTTTTTATTMESFLKQTKISPDDPRVLDLILEEIAEISSTIEVYKQFIISKTANIKGSTVNANNATTMTTTTTPPMDTLIKEPLIYRRIQEIMSFYIPIDMSFMKQSFFKAIQLGDSNQISLNANTDFFASDSDDDSEDDSDDEDESSKYCSIINDVFFILQKSLSRAMDSQNISVVCAIVNHINGILATDYFEFVKKDIQLISLVQSNNKDDFVKILKSLNNIQISSEYILKLKKEFEKSYEFKFFKQKKSEPTTTTISNNASTNASTISTDRMKLKSGASDLVQTSIFFSDELRRYTRKMVSAKEYCLSLEQDISFLLDSELKQQVAFYNLTESQFAARELNNSFTTKFIANMEKVLNVYKKYLTKFNFEELVELAIIILCDYLERQIFGKRFTSYGGLQLDKDVREFMDYFSSKTNRSVRDKFSRLSQIAYLLKMSEVDDILEIWESAQHWKLSVGEIKNVLSLRVDFKQEQIHNLSI